MPRSHLGLVRKTWHNKKTTRKGQNMTKRYNHELLTVDVAIMIFACFELTLGNGLKSKISRILLRVLYRWTYSGREITISDSCHGSKLWTVRRTFHSTDVEIDDGAVKVSVFFERCPGVFVHEITKHSSSVLQRRIEWVMSWKNQSSRHSKTGNEVNLKTPQLPSLVFTTCGFEWNCEPDSPRPSNQVFLQNAQDTHEREQIGQQELGNSVKFWK